MRRRSPPKTSSAKLALGPTRIIGIGGHLDIDWAEHRRPVFSAAPRRGRGRSAAAKGAFRGGGPIPALRRPAPARRRCLDCRRWPARRPCRERANGTPPTASDDRPEDKSLALRQREIARRLIALHGKRYGADVCPAPPAMQALNGKTQSAATSFAESCAEACRYGHGAGPVVRPVPSAF